MKNFEYAAPRSESEAIQLLADEPENSAILAGGTDLVGLMKQMVVTPDRVINIMEIPQLKSIETTPDGGLAIGAAVTLDEILASPYLEPYEAVTHAILGINSMQLQSQGTIGGEVCQRPQCWYFRGGQGLLADGGRTVLQGDNRFHAILGNSGPAKFVSSSRIAPALIAIGAGLRVVDAERESRMSVADFYRVPRHDGQLENVLQPNQLLTHVILPAVDEMSSATYEVRHGEGPEFPLASAAAALIMDGNVVHDARIVMGQVAPVPWVSEEASRMLRGSVVSEEVAEAAGRAAVESATPLSENEYKVDLAKVAVKRSILLAAGLEAGGL